MSENISEETQKKLEQLSRKISVSNRLDDEIRLELKSHMEDKLAGYLDGSEKVNEDDALILVREHFGDPHNIRNLYQEVEDVESNGRLLRKVGALLVLTLVIGLARSFIGLPNVRFAFPYYGLVFLPIAFGAPIILILFPRKWKKDIRNGKAPWFQTITPSTFKLLILALIIARFILSFIAYNANGRSAEIHLLRVQESMFMFIVSGIAWLWWCDVKKISFLQGLAVIATWLTFYTPSLMMWNYPLAIRGAYTDFWNIDMALGYIESPLYPFLILPIAYLAIVNVMKLFKRDVQVASN